MVAFDIKLQVVHEAGKCSQCSFSYNLRLISITIIIALGRIYACLKSDQLFAKAKNILPGGVNSPVRFYEPYPFFATSALGSKLTTADHQIYLDYCMGYGAMILGHGYSSVIEAVRSQLDKGTLFCVPTECEIKLAEMICQVVPCGEMARLVNTGSEATRHAIRLARAFTKRKGAIKFEGGYHGAHDYVLVKAGSGMTSLPASEGMLDEASAHTKVVPYNNPSELERAIEKNRDTACLIMEPVLANIGLVLPEKGYLNEVRKITEQNDIILIFDEVVTGFRLALGGASEFFGLMPDLVTFAKALGNGLPIAAIAGKKDILTRAQLDCTVNSIGSMFQLFFTSERVKDQSGAKKANAKMFRKLFDELLKQDIFIPPSQFETCFLSYAHTEDDADKTIEAYDKAFREIKK